MHGGFMALAADIVNGDKAGHTPTYYLEAQMWGSADLRRDVKEIAIGKDDLKHIVNQVESESWHRFKKQMDAADVKLTYYARWNNNDIKNKPDDWNELQVNVRKLGITFINMANGSTR